MAEGWIKLHRKLLDNPLWTCEPFTRGQAWVDLILLANHEYGFFYKRGIKIEIQRGQVGVSEVGLSDRWKWSRTKVRKFINDLKKEQQIDHQQNNVTQIVTILKYEEYQQKEQQTIQQKDTRSTAEVQQKDTNKKNKEEKNKKKDKEEEEYSPDFLKFQSWMNENCKRVLQLKTQITEENLNHLKSIYDATQISKILMDMENYKKLLSSYESAYLTALKWLKKEYNEQRTEIPNYRPASKGNDASDRRSSVENIKQLAIAILQQPGPEND